MFPRGPRRLTRVPPRASRAGVKLVGWGPTQVITCLLKPSACISLLVYSGRPHRHQHHPLSWRRAGPGEAPLAGIKAQLSGCLDGGGGGRGRKWGLVFMFSLQNEAANDMHHSVGCRPKWERRLERIGPSSGPDPVDPRTICTQRRKFLANEHGPWTNCLPLKSNNLECSPKNVQI